MQPSWNCESSLIFSLLGTSKLVLTWPHPLRVAGSRCPLSSPQPWGCSFGKASCCPLTRDIWGPSRREESGPLREPCLQSCGQGYNHRTFWWEWELLGFWPSHGAFPSQTKSNQAVCLTLSTNVITSVCSYHPAHPSVWEKNWGCQRWGLRSTGWNPWLCHCTLQKGLIETCISCMGWQESNLNTLNHCGHRQFPTLWELSEAKHHPALLHISTLQQPLVHSALDLFMNFNFIFPPNRIMSPYCRQAFRSQLHSRQIKSFMPLNQWEGRV